MSLQLVYMGLIYCCNPIRMVAQTWFGHNHLAGEFGGQWKRIVVERSVFFYIIDVVDGGLL